MRSKQLSYTRATMRQTVRFFSSELAEQIRIPLMAGPLLLFSLSGNPRLRAFFPFQVLKNCSKTSVKSKVREHLSARTPLNFILISY
jgi:hypothetical protein